MSSNNFLEGIIRNKRQDDTEYDESTNNREELIKTQQNGEKNISRHIRSVVMNSKKGLSVDSEIINYNLYNRFNYSLFLSDRTKNLRLSLGVTSANRGEGKTTAACNLAAALSLGSLRRTLIIDLNVNDPAVHKVFGTPGGPGLSEALMGEEVFVTPTQIENLAVLSAGNIRMIPESKLANFNEVLLSLMNTFEFLVVDMPSLSSRNFPTLIANQLNGLVVVLEARRTKRRDIERLFRHVNERNVCGFVLNKVNENDF